MIIKQGTEINFTLNPDENVRLITAPGVFTPNVTTNLLVQAVNSVISNPIKLLDLGCGTGIVGLALYLKGLVESPLYASDLSVPSIYCSRENFKHHNCPADVREGSLFEPWQGEKFDVIVDDISGISQSVADVSPWFQEVPCDTGRDGIDLVADIIQKAPQHLNEGGYFFFPVLSLSNVDKLLDCASKTFASVVRVGRQDWPLPPDLKEHMGLLQKLHEAGAIKLEKKFGMVVCYTEVYCAKNPL